MDDHIRLQKLDTGAYARACRQAASDGIVMLKNDHAVLPLKENAEVALFGRSQLSYFKSGTGSGGMVHVRSVTGILEALEAERWIHLNRELLQRYRDFDRANPVIVPEGWAMEPWSLEEMPVTEEICREAASKSSTAIVIIGRTAGEDKDNKAKEGSYLLTAAETQMLRNVRRAFSGMAVLLNVSNIIDMSWVEEICPDSVLYVWQGGQEGGYGAADVLTGRVCPSGHLTDTIAYSIEDYPSSKNFCGGQEEIYQEDCYVGYRYFETVAKDRVLYPFGFGLSYTQFEISALMVETREREAGSRLSVDLDVLVKNTGHTAGRQVVQVYASCPQASLGKPARVLVDFQKTRSLSPGDDQTLCFRIPVSRFASYDDTGTSSDVSCWVLEEGRYDIYVGDNVRDAVCVTEDAGAFTISNSWPIEQMEEALAPVRMFNRMVVRDNPDLHIEMEPVPVRTVDDYKRIHENLPVEIPYSVGKNTLSDVKNKVCTMDEFIAQFSDKELVQIIRGEGMNSPLVMRGTAAAFGGVSEALREKGIPAVCCDDGPSGMRLDMGDEAFSLPNGTMLACTFDRELNRRLFSFVGLEMLKNHVECLLGPGINIHRNPLNGRNFEYFSEDPYLTGEMAIAQLQGLHERGVTGVIKHFAANNRETGRQRLDSIVSERALREIYLKPFQMAVREGGADAVMTTYGRVNGVQTSSLYDLTTTILREEWGFDGVVMTDWWAGVSPADVIENPAGEGLGPVDGWKLFSQAYCGELRDFSTMVRAQNDLYMVVPDGEDTEGEKPEGQIRTGGTTVQKPVEPGGSGGSSEEEFYSAGKRFSFSTLTALEEGRITRAELQRNAANICRFVMKTEAMRRLEGNGTQVEVTCEPKRGIILDIDGTLWDSTEEVGESWNEYRERCIPEMPEPIIRQQLQGVFGKTMTEIGDILFGQLEPVRRKKVLDEVMRYEVEYIRRSGATLYPELKKTMEKLRSEGWNLYIVSNCQNGYIEDFLTFSDTRDLIADHICFEETGREKGENIRLCAERNLLDEAFYVGDTAGDLEAARKAGIGFVYAQYGFGSLDADAEGVLSIRSFAELAECVKNLNMEKSE